MAEQYSAGIDLFNNIQDLLRGKISLDYISLQFASDNCQYLLAMALFMSRFSLSISLFLFILYMLSFGGLVTKKVMEEENIGKPKDKQFTVDNLRNDDKEFSSCSNYNSKKKDLRYITPFIIILFAIFTKILYRFPRSLSTTTILFFLVLLFFQRFIIFIIHDIGLRITVNAYCSRDPLCSFKEHTDNDQIDNTYNYQQKSNHALANKLSYQKYSIFRKGYLRDRIYDSYSATEFYILIILISLSVIRWIIRLRLYGKNMEISDIFFYLKPYLTFIEKINFNFNHKLFNNTEYKTGSHALKFIIIILYYFTIPDFIEQHVKAICPKTTNLNIFQKIITFIPLFFLIKNIDPNIRNPIHKICSGSILSFTRKIDTSIDLLDKNLFNYYSEFHPISILWQLIFKLLLWEGLSKTILFFCSIIFDLPQIILCWVFFKFKEVSNGPIINVLKFLFKVPLNIVTFLCTYQIIKHIYISNKCFKKPLCISKNTDPEPLNDAPDDSKIQFPEIIDFDQENIFELVLKIIILICIFLILIPPMWKFIKLFADYRSTKKVQNEATNYRNMRDFFKDFHMHIIKNYDNNLLISDNIAQQKINLIYKYFYDRCFSKSNIPNVNTKLCSDTKNEIKLGYYPNLHKYLNSVLKIIINKNGLTSEMGEKINNLLKFDATYDHPNYKEKFPIIFPFDSYLNRSDLLKDFLQNIIDTFYEYYKGGVNPTLSPSVDSIKQPRTVARLAQLDLGTV